MSGGISEETSFPDSAENLENNAVKVITKQAALWFRIDGLIDRLLTAVKHLAALITSMENRIPRGPPDYEFPPPQITVRYEGNTGPSSPNLKEPSWQNSLLGKIIALLIVAGIPSILVALWTIKSDLLDLRDDNKVIVQRVDAQDKHMEETDRDVAEIKREVWPHKH